MDHIPRPQRHPVFMRSTPLVIQTHRGHLRHDFAWVLREALDFAAWWDPTTTYGATYGDTWPTQAIPSTEAVIVPVGTLEWVATWTQIRYQRELSSFLPLTIPSALRTPTWLGRTLACLDRETLLREHRAHPVFLKSATRYKGFVDIRIPDANLPDDAYWVSDVVTFRAEWRAFVHRNTLVGLQRDAGELEMFPDGSTLHAMINADAATAPQAYTLDVGILDAPHAPTVIIEVHPFVCCGLYGWDDPLRLIAMLIDGWRSGLTLAELPDPYLGSHFHDP